MATEPIRERLVTAVQQRLASITAGATYWYTPGEVGRDWRHFQEVRATPFYAVIEGPSEAEPTTLASQVRETQTVIVVGWIKDTSNRRQALNRAIGDVIRAIYVDETWGGLALVTRPPSVITDEAAVVAQPWGYFELTMQIEYLRHRTEV